MKSDDIRPEDLRWQCDKCHRELVVGPVQVAYLGNRFSADLPYCPMCGQVLILEHMALSKMTELEKLLEGK
jgi:ribosomal protein S27AE